MCVTAMLVDAIFMRVTPSVGKILFNSSQSHWHVIKLALRYLDV